MAFLRFPSSDPIPLSKSNIIRSHQIALKSPRREMSLCNTKLKQVHNELQDSLTHNPDTFDHIMFTTRLLHVQGRLKRISSSKTAQVAALKSLSACDQLLRLIHKMVTAETPLSESIASVAAIEVIEGQTSESDGSTNNSVIDEAHTRPDKVGITSSFNNSIGDADSKFAPSPFKSIYANVLSVGRTLNEPPVIRFKENPSNLNQGRSIVDPQPSTSRFQEQQIQQTVRFENIPAMSEPTNGSQLSQNQVLSNPRYTQPDINQINNYYPAHTRPPNSNSNQYYLHPSSVNTAPSSFRTPIPGYNSHLVNPTSVPRYL